MNEKGILKKLAKYKENVIASGESKDNVLSLLIELESRNPKSVVSKYMDAKKHEKGAVTDNDMQATAKLEQLRQPVATKRSKESFER